MTDFSNPTLRLRNGPVQFFDFKDLVVYAGRGGYGVAFSVDLAVRNDAYDKRVGIVWRIVEMPGTGGSSPSPAWRTTSLDFNGMIENGVERWSGHARQMGPVVECVELAAFCRMNGAESWDNAGGYNYRIYSSRTPSPAKGVASWAQVQGDRSVDRVFDGTAWTWDFPGEKRVSVIFSCDNWDTVHVVDATWTGTEWHWRTGVPDGPHSSLEFAVRYRVGDAEFWDNNAGRNYSVRLSHEA